VVLNPATPAALLEDILPDVEQVLVMTVNPGFGGQEFIATTVGKIARVRDLLLRWPGRELEVDGGIEPHTVKRAVDAGAQVLVAGSAIFHYPGGVAAGMEQLRAALRARPTGTGGVKERLS
jgi:ribulose-phosphate 3-epimerase